MQALVHRKGCMLESRKPHHKHTNFKFDGLQVLQFARVWCR
jgi:hypothetical protein